MIYIHIYIIYICMYDIYIHIYIYIYIYLYIANLLIDKLEKMFKNVYRGSKSARKLSNL